MSNITIGVLTWNDEKRFLIQCLDSIRRQKGDYKVIIRDDGSIDNTSEIVCCYIARHKLDWLFVQGNHVGGSLGRKAIIDLCNTAYICFVDSDDKLIGGNVIITSEKYLPKYDLVYWNIVSSFWQNYHSGDLLADITGKDRTVDPRVNCVCKTDLYRNFEWYAPTFAEVVYIMTAVLVQDPKYIFLDKPVYFYRAGFGSQGGTISKTSNEMRGMCIRFYDAKIADLLIEYKRRKKCSAAAV